MTQETFRALSDPTRRDILVMLRKNEMTIAQISAQFAMTRPAVKKHLDILQKGHLISTRKQGREIINQLNFNGLEPIIDWLTFFDSFWDDRLDKLKFTLENKD